VVEFLNVLTLSRLSQFSRPLAESLPNCRMFGNPIWHLCWGNVWFYFGKEICHSQLCCWRFFSRKIKLNFWEFLNWSANKK